MRRSTRSFWRSESGNIAIISALCLPALIGFCGLSADMGYWYYRQRVDQAAADIAAYDATVALRSGATIDTIQTAGKQAAVQNGWATATGSITINTPPVSGTHQDGRSVEVLLSEKEPRFFTALFSPNPVIEKTRAVATFTYSSSACMLSLARAGSGAMTFWGNAAAQFIGCNVVSNSIANGGFKIGGAANVTTPCAASAGGGLISGTLTLTQCSSMTTNSPPAVDPYASVPVPPVSSQCASSSGSQLYPGTYCRGLSLNGTANLAPGVYVVSGGTLKINANANLTGSGVTFYLTNGATLSMNGSAQMNLSAPTSGTYAGLLFFGDRSSAGLSETINGDASSRLTGAIYFPADNVSFLGNFSGANGCTQVVANSIYYTGSATFNNDCNGSGMSTIEVPSVVSLVE